MLKREKDSVFEHSHRYNPRLMKEMEAGKFPTGKYCMSCRMWEQKFDECNKGRWGICRASERTVTADPPRSGLSLYIDPAPENLRTHLFFFCPIFMRESRSKTMERWKRVKDPTEQ